MSKLVGPKKPPERTQDLIRHLQALLEQPASGDSGRLPSERQLAERFHCSRNTVREALAALAAQGRIDIRGRVGAYAAPLPAAATRESDLEQALCALGIAAPPLSHLAAKACATAGVERLETVISNLSQALLDRDVKSAYLSCVAFFTVLAEVVGNTYLSGMLLEIKEAARLIPPGRLFQRDQMEAFFSGLVALLQALRRGDGQDAASLAARCLEAFAAVMRTAKPPRIPSHPEGTS